MSTHVRVIEYLIRRPIGLIMSLVALCIVSFALTFKLPVSLLPDTEVPRLEVEVYYSSGSPLFIEQSILEPLRLSLQGLYGLKSIESIATSGSGRLSLRFTYDADMRIAYVQSNERIDQIISALPTGLTRPVVRRVMATSIPVARLQVQSQIYSPQELSDFCSFIVKRRLEQMEGVSMVEMNGEVRKVIQISPKPDMLRRYQIKESELVSFIQSSNLPLSQIRIREGIYEYSLTFDNLVSDGSSISQLRYQRDGLPPVLLSTLADVKEGSATREGVHLFQGSEGVVFTIQKRDQASFYKVRSDIDQVIYTLQKEYPQFLFRLTQDQFDILDESIIQLVFSIALGTFLAVVIIFLFSGDWKSPLLMAILIPISVLLALAVMYVAGQSLNIVSLSGILLGIGILIDNGIILIDNISEKNKNSDLLASCTVGVSEMMPALWSSALTTLSVFLPLIFLQGVAGALFSSQIITLSILLTCSLVVAFLLLPFSYFYLRPDPLRQSSKLYLRVLQLYTKTQSSKKTRAAIFVVLAFLAAAGIFGVTRLDKVNLPAIERSDMAVLIRWNQNTVLEESRRRVSELVSLSAGLVEWEADVGMTDLAESDLNQRNQARLYLKFNSISSRKATEELMSRHLRENYPGTEVNIARARNPYDQLFPTTADYAVFKVRGRGEDLISQEFIEATGDPDLLLGRAFRTESAVRVLLKNDRLRRFDVSQVSVLDKLQLYFSGREITRLNQVSESIPVLLAGTTIQQLDVLSRLTVVSNDTVTYPLSTFLSWEEAETPRYVLADITGRYYDLRVEQEVPHFERIRSNVQSAANKNNLEVSLAGEITEIATNQRSLYFAIVLAIVLLFVILASQFESFRMPVIIMSEIPISAAGALLGLWVCDQQLSVSALMGILIVLGIIVNDSILKVDTIRRMEKSGMPQAEAVATGGKLRFKPILMTSLTTILALVPVLVGSGFGAAIQKPLAISVIFGLSVGTLCSIYLIPALYTTLVKRRVSDQP